MNEELDMLRFIAITINALAGECNLSADSARTLAARLVNLIREQFGGERHYVRAPTREPRNSEILAAHDAGETQAAIAKRFGIHITTVKRVIARHRLPPQRPAQSDGFGPRGWNL